MPLPAESPSPAPVVLSPPSPSPVMSPSPSPVVSPSPADDDEDDDSAPGGPFEAFGPSEGLPDSHQHCAPHFPPGNEQAAGMADLWAEADADGDCVLNAAELKALLEHLTAPSFFGDILEEAAARREESADAFLSRMADNLITFADGSEVFQDTDWRDASATTPEALLAMDLTFDDAITPWEFISGLHKLRHTGSSAANGGENQCAYHFDDFEVSNEQGCWCGSECEPGDGPCDGSDLPGGWFALMWVASLPKLDSDRARFMDFCVNEAVAIDLWAPLMQVLGARGEGPDPRVDCSDEREFARVLRGFTLCGDCASPDNCFFSTFEEADAKAAAAFVTDPGDSPLNAQFAANISGFASKAEFCAGPIPAFLWESAPRACLTQSHGPIATCNPGYGLVPDQYSCDDPEAATCKEACISPHGVHCNDLCGSQTTGLCPANCYPEWPGLEPRLPAFSDEFCTTDCAPYQGCFYCAEDGESTAPSLVDQYALDDPTTQHADCTDETVWAMVARFVGPLCGDCGPGPGGLVCQGDELDQLPPADPFAGWAASYPSKLALCNDVARVLGLGCATWSDFDNQCKEDFGFMPISFLGGCDGERGQVCIDACYDPDHGHCGDLCGDPGQEETCPGNCFVGAPGFHSDPPAAAFSENECGAFCVGFQGCIALSTGCTTPPSPPPAESPPPSDLCEQSQLFTIIPTLSQECQGTLAAAVANAGAVDSSQLCACYLEVPEDTMSTLTCKTQASDTLTIYEQYQQCQQLAALSPPMPPPSPSPPPPVEPACTEPGLSTAVCTDDSHCCEGSRCMIVEYDSVNPDDTTYESHCFPAGDTTMPQMYTLRNGECGVPAFVMELDAVTDGTFCGDQHDGGFDGTAWNQEDEDLCMGHYVAPDDADYAMPCKYVSEATNTLTGVGDHVCKAGSSPTTFVKCTA